MTIYSFYCIACGHSYKKKLRKKLNFVILQEFDSVLENHKKVLKLIQVSQISHEFYLSGKR